MKLLDIIVVSFLVSLGTLVAVNRVEPLRRLMGALAPRISPATREVSGATRFF